MKKPLYIVSSILILSISPVFSQGKSAETITASELENHVTFLASPLLKGRMNGDESLDIAANYLAVQAGLTGLKPANGNSFFQPFTVLQKKADPSRTNMSIIDESGDTAKIFEPFFHIIPQGPAELDIEGEIVFAGYGIKTETYNDLENINLKGKIVLVMDRGPVKDGSPVLNNDLYGEMSFQYKIGALLSPGPKAILFVPDPASGFHSFEEASPELSGFLSSITRLSGEEEKVNLIMNMMPKIIFITRAAADAIMDGTGRNLSDLQKEIDASLKPVSFPVTGKKLIITERNIEEEIILNNVVAFIEGSHPVKKDEVVIFSAHYDHVGSQGGKIIAGADDNASGCAALLEMAEAFAGLKKKPLRSVLFLWVAGEEIGLYGSKTYVNNPLFPLRQTVANLNMDMIGRIREAADSTPETPMTGPEDLFVITGGQSSELTSIANDVAKRSSLKFDYSLSGPQHPLQLFSRSDHYNFVRKDIPVLFFTTGLHTDYHSPGDVISKINFNKMELVTRTIYDIGFTVANRKERLIVDNPFSSWGKK